MRIVQAWRAGSTGTRTSLVAVAALVASVLLVPMQSATADPAPTVPSTVSADPLPTVQTNGVVWSTVTLGNITYATGNFSLARPAGNAAGVGEVTRGGLIAFDVTTGVMTSFNHSLNAAGRMLTASPDGKTLYVVGDFTTVDGQARGHVAAFDTASGALVSGFAPSVNDTALAVAATNSAVYVGGSFSSANGAARNRLAAFSAVDGSLTSWAPTADNGTVTAMTMSPNLDRVVIGGRFTTLNRGDRYGIGAVDASSGALTAWNSAFPIRDAGSASSLTSLHTYGSLIYATGYVFGAGGNFEGVAAFDETGQLNYMNSCHGDHYDAFVTNGVTYAASHAHDCSDPNSFPEQSTRIWKRATANLATSDGSCTAATNNEGGYANFAGQPCASMLTWYPDFAAGTATGAGQGPWTTSGNSNYVVMGGEFPTVNKVAQAGLVRFAIRSIAPNKVAPKATAGLLPTAVSYSSGTARVTWQTTNDIDDRTLTYKLYRGNSATPIYTVDAASDFWNMPYLRFTDTGLTPGSSQQYRMSVSDPSGNTINTGKSVAVTISSAPLGTYGQDVLADGASNYWRLGETSGTTANDYAGSAPLTLNGSVTRGQPGAISGDADGATGFSGSSAFGSTQTPQAGPNVFTTEAWFKTTSSSGGKIVGFGDRSTGNSSNYDRHVYMDGNGRVNFGVYNNNSYIITTPNALNDGQWHHVAASLGTTGMTLWVDGRQIGTNAGTITGQPYSGYWRVGGDSTWAGANYFNGTIDDVAVYPSVLARAQVLKHYADSGRTLPPGSTAPADSYGSAVWNDSPAFYYRMNETNGPAAADASGNQNNGVYSGGTTFAAAGAAGTAVTFNGSNGTLGSGTAVSNPRVYSEELWFRTTTTSGGKLIGFGSRQSGSSSSNDRHVYMTPNGRLTFGAYTGVENKITTPVAYNDGAWHHLVATQGNDGMKLYVDGAQRASNTVSGNENTTGYWRVGGDTAWEGVSYFNGTIDEAAVYNYVLTPAQVTAHRAASALVNRAPTAAFTGTPTNLTAAFDGSGSSDPDGTIASYAWNYGDGQSDTGVAPSHVYAAAGTYQVTLTVTDNAGATASVTRPITVTAPNQAPVAAFDGTKTDLTASFDAGGSSDPDGTIASYAWNFGDTQTDTGAKPTHVYAAAGTYQVTLTVTDNAGATTSLTKPITVTAPVPNQAPTSAFTATVNGKTVAVDGSGSTDPDGTIAGYAWQYGDGTSDTGVSPSHTYADSGTYTVTLTVTDNSGATSSSTKSVTIGGPTLLAGDDFSRTQATGWGTADTGGGWTMSSAAASSTNGSVGRLNFTAAGSTRSAYLNGVSSSDTDISTKVSTSVAASGGGAFVTLVGRKVAGAGDYRAKVQLLSTGAVRISLLRADASGVETAIGSGVTVAGLTYTPGDVLQIRLRAIGTGTTSLAASVWKDGTTEPTTPTVSATDTTSALQAAGSVGLFGYLSGSTTTLPMTMSFDAVRVYVASTR